MLDKGGAKVLPVIPQLIIPIKGKPNLNYFCRHLLMTYISCLEYP